MQPRSRASLSVKQPEVLRRLGIAAVGAALVTTSLSALAVPVSAVNAASPAAPAPAQAKIAVTIATPKGVPASVTLSGRATRVVAKPVAGARFSRTVKVPGSRYRVIAPTLNYQGSVYAARVSRPVVTVRGGAKAAVRVVYRKVNQADRLGFTEVTPTSASLRWRAPKRRRTFVATVLRRTEGAIAAQSVTDGTGVVGTPGKAVDSGLAPATSYTYALFTKAGRGWSKPVTLTVSTPSADGDKTAYALAPTTRILQPDSFTARQVGTKVAVKLGAGTAPTIGSAVVLPPSDQLPGGWLGKVVSVSPDGTSLLEPGSLTDAFSFADFNIDFAKLGTKTLTPIGDPARAAAALARANAGQPAARRMPAQICTTTGGWSYTYNWSASPEGHFGWGYKFYWFGDKAAWIDTHAAIRLHVGVSLAADGAVSCSIPFQPLYFNFWAGPVPMTLGFTPVARLDANGKISITNAALDARAGAWVQARVGDGSYFRGGLIRDLNVTPPAVAATANLSMRAGGNFYVGVGYQSGPFGATVGLGGSLFPMVLDANAHFASADLRHNLCLDYRVGGAANLGLQAKFWVSWFKTSAYWPIPGANASWTYSSGNWPQGCQNLPAPVVWTPVFSKSVELLAEFAKPSQVQSVVAPGFVPNKNTWLLTTGRKEDLNGAPSDNASTDLGQPGDDQITKFYDVSTYDAAVYEADVVPEGNTLHIKYLYASEEYPLPFEGPIDHTLITINGEVCSGVYNADQVEVPVDSTLINLRTQESLYVDNSHGSSGYNTTMNGLTVPLTCSMPVKPGQPARVRIAIADSRDGYGDSAIGLVDGGIWSD